MQLRSIITNVPRVAFRLGLIGNYASDKNNLNKYKTMNKLNNTEKAENNTMLCAGILDILRNHWGNHCGKFEAYWFGYETLKDVLHENSIYADVDTIKSAMKELSKQNKVELRPTYNEDWLLSGRGWFACT